MLTAAEATPTPETINDNLTGLLITLSRAQYLVVECMLLGMSVDDTAKKLGISSKTVKFHRTRIYKKYNVKGIGQFLCKTENISVEHKSTAIARYEAERRRSNYEVKKTIKEVTAKSIELELKYQTQVQALQNSLRITEAALKKSEVQRIALTKLLETTQGYLPGFKFNSEGT